MLKGRKDSAPLLVHSQLCSAVMAAASHISMKVITSGCIGLPALKEQSFAVIDEGEEARGKEKMSGLELNAKQQLSPLIVPPE